MTFEIFDPPKLSDVITFGPPRYPQQDAWVRTPGVEPPTITISYRDARFEWDLKDLERTRGPEIELRVKELERRFERRWLEMFRGA